MDFYKHSPVANFAAFKSIFSISLKNYYHLHLFERVLISLENIFYEKRCFCLFAKTLLHSLTSFNDFQLVLCNCLFSLFLNKTFLAVYLLTTKMLLKFFNFDCKYEDFLYLIYEKSIVSVEVI